MELRITGKNVELSPEIYRYVERKLGKLARYLPDAMEGKVEITEEKTKSPQQHYVVQVKVNGSGTTLHGEERAADLFTAINRVAAVINRQIEHRKGKRDDQRKGIPEIRSRPAEMIDTDKPPVGDIAVERVSVENMPVEEAIYQMEALGNDFFFFINDDTGKLSLLYHHRDGGFGIVEPEAL